MGRLLLESSLNLSNGLLFGTTFRIDDTEESTRGMRHFLGLADDAAFQVIKRRFAHGRGERADIVLPGRE